MKDQHESVITPRDMAAIKWAAAVIGILLFVLGVTSGSFGLAFGVGMVIICVMAPAFAAGLIVRRRKPIPVEYEVVAVVFLLTCWAFGGVCLYLSHKHGAGHPEVSFQVFTGGIMLFAVGVVIPLVARAVARIPQD